MVILDRIAEVSTGDKRCLVYKIHPVIVVLFVEKLNEVCM